MLGASWPSLALLCAAAFLVGSIPFGLLVGRVLRGVDLRHVGSGNIGAANAFRSLGPFYGVLVLLLDAVKGFLPVLLAGRMFALLSAGQGPAPATAEVWVGLCAIVGHNNSVFLGFKGGKGIATMFGVLLALSPPATLIAALVWGGVIALTRYASVASLAAATSIPLTFMAYGAPTAHVVFGMLACVLAYWRHRGNLANLAQGRELRIGGAQAAPRETPHP